MAQLICQRWLESERGWGERPDGISAHASREDLEQFGREYGGLGKGQVPDEYSRPKGSSFVVTVDESVFRGLKLMCKERETHGKFITNTSWKLDEASFSRFQRECADAAQRQKDAKG